MAVSGASGCSPSESRGMLVREEGRGILPQTCQTMVEVRQTNWRYRPRTLVVLQNMAETRLTTAL